MNKILCSTGTIVGRACGYKYSLIKEHIPSLLKNGLIDGMEFMMIPFYYDKLDKISNLLISCDVPTPIIHCEKDIGVMLSDGDDFITNDAFKLLIKNCEIGKEIGAEKMVFHLWGGSKSDSNIEYNISKLPKINEIVSSYGLKLLIENIPCTNNSGLQNWRRLYKFLPQIGFIFDTRFGAFHDEIDEILDEPIWNDISHIHISDYSSFPRDFSKIRPILHPGEGVIDFDKIFNGLKKNNYTGSITLESPVMIPDGADIEKLKASLIYIKNKIEM